MVYYLYYYVVIIRVISKAEELLLETHRNCVSRSLKILI